MKWIYIKKKKLSTIRQREAMALLRIRFMAKISRINGSFTTTIMGLLTHLFIETFKELNF